jgi:hypothetical protein
MAETVLIKIDSKHVGFNANRKAYNAYIIIKYLVNFGIVIYISNLLYNNVLFAKEANPIVTTYLCLIALGCFLNIGVPIDKISNVSLPVKP